MTQIWSWVYDCCKVRTTFTMWKALKPERTKLSWWVMNPVIYLLSLDFCFFCDQTCISEQFCCMMCGRDPRCCFSFIAVIFNIPVFVICFRWTWYWTLCFPSLCTCLMFNMIIYVKKMAKCSAYTYDNDILMN